MTNEPTQGTCLCKYASMLKHRNSALAEELHYLLAEVCVYSSNAVILIALRNSYPAQLLPLGLLFLLLGGIGCSVSFLALKQSAQPMSIAESAG